jgi:hypothetical protein
VRAALSDTRKRFFSACRELLGLVNVSLGMRGKSLQERLVEAEEGVRRANELVQRHLERIDVLEREGETTGPARSTLEWLKQILQMRIASRDRLRRQISTH